MKRRVVITGWGIVTSLSCEVDDLFNRILEGQSGIHDIKLCDVSDIKVSIGGDIYDWSCRDLVGSKEEKKLDRYSQFAIVGAEDAVNSSGLEFDKGADLTRFGAVLGSGIGGMATIPQQMERLIVKGPDRVSPMTIPNLSGRNDDPTTASRPFDADRDGFVFAEGAGILIFEELEHAKARGANILAEVVGFGTSCDAGHITSPDEHGVGAAQAMQAALDDAELNADQIDYINAHGTSTPLGDKAETQAIKAVFGDHAYNVSISSTKSQLGHSLGASGGIELILAVKAIHASTIPPTINLDNEQQLWFRRPQRFDYCSQVRRHVVRVVDLLKRSCGEMEKGALQRSFTLLSKKNAVGNCFAM